MSAWSFFPSSNCFTFCFRLSHFNLCLQASFCTPPPYTENFCTFARADFLGNSVGKKIPYLSCQSCWMVWDADLIVLLQATQGYVVWWAEGVADEGAYFSSLCASLAVYGCSLQYCWGTPILQHGQTRHHFAVSNSATYPKISTAALNQGPHPAEHDDQVMAICWEFRSGCPTLRYLRVVLFPVLCLDNSCCFQWEACIDKLGMGTSASALLVAAAHVMQAC